MFAVMKTGGKQYKVQSGDMLRVEKLAADAGETVQFNEILMLGGDKTVVGAPMVDGAAVQAEVVDQIKGEKVINFVKRRRKHGSQRTKGHRQKLTLVRIGDILASGGDRSGVKAAIGAGAVSGGGETAPNSAPKKAAVKATTAPTSAGSDDLTAITGVGPAAVKKLNEAGITTYKQIAAIDVDTFDAVKVKAEWVEQASTLAKG
ncbi:50S ribosomal protein L21 [Planktotalea sp.]|uniref:50S ribosomal protein L21 n=1 Tax=Planktotalea sp. TaxID=2029877 RepID=UPI0025ED3B22|nr:50S ribosomal protein L21 [Planktotalea sp.]